MAGCKVCIGQRWTDNLHWQPGQAQSKGCQVVRGNITSKPDYQNNLTNVVQGASDHCPRPAIPDLGPLQVNRDQDRWAKCSNPDSGAPSPTIGHPCCSRQGLHCSPGFGKTPSLTYWTWFNFLGVVVDHGACDWTSPSTAQGQAVWTGKPLLSTMKSKFFIQAVTVANICDKSLDDKSRRIQHIETLMAFDLFCNYKFRCLNPNTTQADINIFSARVWQCSWDSILIRHMW